MSLEQEVELIRQFPIFSKLQPAMQKLLCFGSERMIYAPGQPLFQKGEVADGVYIVIDGTAEVWIPSEGGPVAINTMGRNALIGEIAVMGGIPRTANVSAVTRLEVLKISKDLFFNVIRENPDAALELIRILAERLAITTDRYSKTITGSR